MNFCLNPWTQYFAAQQNKTIIFISASHLHSTEFFQSFVAAENQLIPSFRDKSGEDLYAKLKVFKLI